MSCHVRFSPDSWSSKQIFSHSLILPHKNICKTLICNIFKWFKRPLWGLFEFPQLKQPYSNRSVLCQGFPRGGFEGMIHFSKPYQLHPTPPYNNATVCSPRSLDAHSPPPTPRPHVRCCCVVLFPHSWSISLCTPPPLCFSSIQPKQRLRSSSHTMQIVSEDKQERETDRGCRGQWNSWLG